MSTGDAGDPKPPRLPPPFLVPALIKLRNRLGAVHRDAMPPIVRVFETTFGFIEAKALGVAAELGLADALAARPLPPAELAAAVGADEDALARLLRLLSSLGYFRRDADGRWGNTAASQLLRGDRPDSVREWVRFVCGDWHGEIWNHALHSFRTGDSATDEALGEPFFAWLSAHAEAHATFDAAMEQSSQLVAPFLASRYDFGDAHRICDVGGGTGALLGALLAANPGTAGVLFDLPEVVARAEPVLESVGVADRCELTGGSFFDAVPAGCDRYVLKAILHDWADPECVTILSRIRAVMAPGARVLVVDQLMPDDITGPHPAKDSDVLMLVLTGAGRERTAAEFATLFARAGLRRERLVPSPVVAVQELVAL